MPRRTSPFLAALLAMPLTLPTLWPGLAGADPAPDWARDSRSIVAQLGMRAEGLLSRLQMASISGEISDELLDDLSDYGRFGHAVAGALMIDGSPSERAASAEIEAVTDRYEADLGPLVSADTERKRRLALPTVSAALETLHLVARDIEF